MAAGVVLPDDSHRPEHIELDGAIPSSPGRWGDVQIEQRVWMAHGRNTPMSPTPTARLRHGAFTRPLCTYRDHHHLTRGGFAIDVQRADAPPWPDGHALIITAKPKSNGKSDSKSNGAETRPYRIAINRGTIFEETEWWWNFHLSAEKARGEDDQEDLFAAATLTTGLELGETLAWRFTTEDATRRPGTRRCAPSRPQRALIAQAALPPDAPAWVEQLVLRGGSLSPAHQWRDRPEHSGGYRGSRTGS